jgi:hypothetical protein
VSAGQSAPRCQCILTAEFARCEVGWTARVTRNLIARRALVHGDYNAARPSSAVIAMSSIPIRRQTCSVSAPPRLGCQAGRLNLPRYVITWSGHLQACVQGWPSRNRGVFPAVDHDRSRT